MTVTATPETVLMVNVTHQPFTDAVQNELMGADC